MLFDVACYSSMIAVCCRLRVACSPLFVFVYVVLLFCLLFLVFVVCCCSPLSLFVVRCVLLVTCCVLCAVCLFVVACCVLFVVFWSL